MTVQIKSRQRLVVANAINLITEINRIIVENRRKGTPAELQFPRLFDRAFILHHEAGVFPVADVLSEE